MSRSLPEKVMFKLVRLPLPLSLRRRASHAMARLSTRPAPRTKNADSALWREGQVVEDGAAIGVDLTGMLDLVRNCQVFDQWTGQGTLYNHDEVPDGINVGEVVPSAELAHRVEAIGRHLSTQDVVTSYFGCVPKVVDSSLWWSYGGREEREAQLWHRDIDNLYFLKVFIYLTDVGPGDGPHEYVLGSHRWNKALNFRRFTPAQLAEDFPGARQVSCIGPAGTTIIEDTFGFHRGTVPNPGRCRCILQYQFALFPNP